MQVQVTVTIDQSSDFKVNSDRVAGVMVEFIEFGLGDAPTLSEVEGEITVQSVRQCPLKTNFNKVADSLFDIEGVTGVVVRFFK